MALLDFLNRKKEIEKHARQNAEALGGAKKPVKKTEKISAIKEKKVIEPNTNVKVNNRNFSFEAIKQPHISEKATYLSEKDQYVFTVSPNFNKTEIKNAVEGLYKVNVLSVNIIKIPAKKRRLGKTEGFRKAYKKAVVKIKNGQKIEIL